MAKRGRPKLIREVRYCEQCKTVELKFNQKKFCSGKCYGKWISENKSGENHPSWKGGKVMIPCSYCGTPLSRKLCEIEKHDDHFCSSGCHGKWQIENKSGENHPAWKGGKVMVMIPCDYCGKENPYPLYKIKEDKEYFCLECTGKGRLGENSPNWKGGRRIKEGYVKIYRGKGKYESEHRLVMEEHLGRKLVGEELVHHINEIRDDNRIENLMLLPNQAAHRRLHAIMEKEKLKTGA